MLERFREKCCGSNFFTELWKYDIVKKHSGFSFWLAEMFVGETEELL